MDNVIKNLETVSPALLLSMPQLGSPNFRRGVVLLCQHSTEDGACGASC